MRILSNKKYEALKIEKKGYFEALNNQLNAYFRVIAPQLRGMELTSAGEIDRKEIKRLYENSAPVQGVVNMIADNVGDVSRYLELYDRKTGQYVESHFIYDLLVRPNDRFSQRKFFTAWAVNKCLFGDAWVYAPKAIGRNFGKVEEMYILPSYKVCPERGGITQPLKALKFTGGIEGIDVGDVFESFDYNLDDTSFLGTSKIVAAAVYLSVLERGMNREATALQNGGVANLITPLDKGLGIMPSDADDMEDKLNNIENVNGNIALRLPVDVKQLGNTPIDLSILESHKEAVTALCFVFKIPVDLYYGQSKYENAKEAKKTIFEQCAIPLVNEFAEDLLRYLKLDKDFELKVNTEEIDVLKAKASDVLDNIAKMHGTINELREANGYEPLDDPDADKPIVPMGVTFGFDAYDISE